MAFLKTRHLACFLGLAILCRQAYAASDTVGSGATANFNGGTTNGNTMPAQGDLSKLKCILDKSSTMLSDLKKSGSDSNLKHTPDFTQDKADAAAAAFTQAFSTLESKGIAQKMSHNCLMQLLSFSIEESGLDPTAVQKGQPAEKTGAGYIQITGSENFTKVSQCTGSAGSASIAGVSSDADSSALAALCFFDQNYVDNSTNKDVCDNSSDTGGQTKMLSLMNSGKVDGNCTDRASGSQMPCTEATDEVKRRLNTFQVLDQASVACPQ